jgi:ribosomal-protein-alanine N-acetyltransferase
MGKGFRIEPATIEMLSDILFLEEACFSAPWTRKMMQAEFTGNRFAHFLVARAGEDEQASPNRIVGYLCFWIVFEEVRLMNLAVHESIRRRGVATALVSEALQAGAVQAATRAVLEVRASNHSAQALYRSMGFRHVSTRTKYYNNPVEDAVLMEMEPLAVPRQLPRARVNTVRDGAGPAH